MDVLTWLFIATPNGYFILGLIFFRLFLAGRVLDYVSMGDPDLSSRVLTTIVGVVFSLAFPIAIPVALVMLPLYFLIVPRKTPQQKEMAAQKKISALEAQARARELKIARLENELLGPY